MKNTFFLFSLLSLFAISSFSLKAQITFPITTENTAIIATLFEGTHDAEAKMCQWKPNLHEKLQFGEPQNIFLYTRLDHVADIKQNGTPYKILITNTFSSSYGGYDCFACAPSVSITVLKVDNKTKQYKLDYFYKFVGQYGKNGEADALSIIQFPNGKYIIRIDGGNTKHGNYSDYSSFIYNGKEFLFCYTLDNNYGQVGPDSPESYETKTDIKIGDEKQPTLHLITSGSIVKSNYKGDNETRTINEYIRYQLIGNQWKKICE